MQLEIVNHGKLLGLNLSSDLKWNIHISEIVKKTASKLYFLRQLKRSKVASRELTQFYITRIRPVTEYVCQVYHNSLPDYLNNDLERLQKRAMCIIYPERGYAEALNGAGLQPLSEIRLLRQSSLNGSPPTRIIGSTLFSQKRKP